MEELIARLEEIKSSLVAQGIQDLQTDTDLSLHVVAGLPKVRSLVDTLKSVQAQQAQVQVPAQ